MGFDRSGDLRRRRQIPGCAPAALALGLESKARVVAAHGVTRSAGTRLPVADGFELDLDARVLRHHGRPVHLRPKEFELLAAMAAEPGRAFTRGQLLERAWASKRGVDLRTVDVHVHWLRAKIELEPARPTNLVTIRGYGYRLDPTAR